MTNVKLNHRKVKKVTTSGPNPRRHRGTDKFSPGVALHSTSQNECCCCSALSAQLAMSLVWLCVCSRERKRERERGRLGGSPESGFRSSKPKVVSVTHQDHLQTKTSQQYTYQLLQRLLVLLAGPVQTARQDLHGGHPPKTVGGARESRNRKGKEKTKPKQKKPA